MNATSKNYFFSNKKKNYFATEADNKHGKKLFKKNCKAVIGA